MKPVMVSYFGLGQAFTVTQDIAATHPVAIMRDHTDKQFDYRPGRVVFQQLCLLSPEIK